MLNVSAIKRGVQSFLLLTESLSTLNFFTDVKEKRNFIQVFDGIEIYLNDIFILNS